MTLRIGSFCTGIAAPEVAWHSFGWTPVFFSEINSFASAVLVERFPGVPNLGDMEAINAEKIKGYEPVDVVCAGTPCQSFSVAGLRGGMADPRGNLALVFLRLVDWLRPTWLVWENVPGVLSSENGRDFGTFLGALGQLGYGWAYRVLDAQHFGVPQRRRRVFVVGYLGDWRCAAAVLFERHCLSGHPAPNREAGTGTSRSVAASLRSSGAGTSRVGDTRGQDNIVMAHGQSSAEIVSNGSPSLTCNHESPILAHPLRADGFDASEDGTGRGTPLVITQPIPLLEIGKGTTSRGAGPNGCGIGKERDPMFTLQAGAQHAVAFQSSQSGVREVEAHATLDSNNGSRRHNGVMTGMAVRRLTPRECERLQGFPDDYTLIPYRGKPAADGNRYRAIGNSMAVPVLRWIGERIEKVQAVLREHREGGARMTTVAPNSHRINILIPVRTVSEANVAGSRHWWHRHKRARDQRGLTATLLRLDHRTPPALPATITLTRLSPRLLDSDNLHGALKHVRDGVADYFGVDDRDERYEWVVKQERSKECGVRIEIAEGVAK